MRRNYRYGEWNDLHTESPAQLNVNIECCVIFRCVHSM